MTKKISIVVTTYNGERYIREQLDSLLAQTYPIYEIIVQDDGSKDRTWDILEEYKGKTPTIHPFHNEGRHGVNGNVYSAIARATGDLIAICDQDDIWEPQKIEEQVGKIGGAMLIGGTTLPFSDDGNPVSCDTRAANCNILRLVFASAIPGHSMLFTPELLQKFPQIDETCYDAQLQVAAAAMESFVYQGICPVHQRRHTDASTYTRPVESTRTIGNVLRYLLSCIRIYPRVRPIQIQRMKIWHDFLEDIDVQTQSRTKALKMTELMQRRDIRGRFLSAAYCYRNRTHLFYTEEADSLLLRIRALLYPLLSVFYYRKLELA